MTLKNLSKRYRVDRSTPSGWLAEDSWINEQFAKEDAIMRSFDHKDTEYRVVDTHQATDKTIANYENGYEL